MLKNPVIYHTAMIALGIGLAGLSYLIAVAFGVEIVFNWLEFVAVATSYTCTILFCLQTRSAYAYGIISTFFLCWFFKSEGVMALATFNGILVLSLIYGYFRWGPDGNPIPVTRIETWKAWGYYFLFFLAIAVGFYSIVGFTNPDSIWLSLTDIMLAAASAVAQWQLDRKKISNWYIWIVINVFSIPYFFYQGYILLGIQFIFFLANAVVALYKWKETMKEQEEEDADNHVQII